MSTPSDFRLGHRKCLDGVRGLAVLAVLVFHLPQMPITGGFIGVDLFFVLSGFLITSLLLEEWKKHATLSFGRFYLRRALRLLPALAMVIGASLLVSGLTETGPDRALTRRMALYAIGYIANYARCFGVPTNPFLGHTWSLSIEEHFYLLWPLSLFLLLRSRWPRGAVSGIMVTLILASAAVRATYWFEDGAGERAYFYTPARLDGVLIGSFTALLLAWGYAPERPASRMLLQLGGIVSLVTFLSFAINGCQGPAFYLGGVLLNVGLASLIGSLLLTPTRPLLLIFENPILSYLGRISYGLYLWHPCVYAVVRINGPERTELRWLACLTMTLGISTLSFYLVERPILGLRERLKRREQPQALESKPI